MSANREVRTIRGSRGPIEVFMQGSGRAVVLLPSLGRGAEDFDQLAALLADRGFLAVCPQPRGIGGSLMGEQPLTFAGLVDDVADVIRQAGLAPAIVVGHAAGNFIARGVATHWPELVAGVAMLAGLPGRAPENEPITSPGVREHIDLCANTALPDEVRLESLRHVFFAPGSDPSGWLEGWYPEVKALQFKAFGTTPVDDFFEGGAAPILEVQAEEDATMSPGICRLLKDQLGERVSTVRIPDAGHALIPEQPERVADAIADWLDRLEPARLSSQLNE